MNSRGILQRELFDEAKRIKEGFFDNEVIKRGVIEISNICDNSCNYCSMSKENKQLERYIIPTENILNIIKERVKDGFKIFQIVSGETSRKI